MQVYIAIYGRETRTRSQYTIVVGHNIIIVTDDHLKNYYQVVPCKRTGKSVRGEMV